MDKQKFFITTAIPYVNAKPHVGHALEFVQTDTIARYQKLLGRDVKLLSGSDENSLKNVQAAESADKEIQAFVDENSIYFQNLTKSLNVHIDFFQKGSNPDHYISSQELWKKCDEAGDIYRKDYTGFYCVGCELFYEKEELDEKGECFEHPGKPLQEVSESNYFFKLSKYQNQIKELIESNALKITPQSRKNEMLSFIERGLSDISISRSNERAKNWGVPVPKDDSQRMYVWFDALNIYRSGLGTDYENYWPADVHVIGKGITRFHAIYWPAFLMSANLPLPKALFVHGYLTVDGQKISKSLGNVIDPMGLIEKYGTDALRYYLLSQVPSTDDGDFSEEKLKTIYNADLANGLGNLVARVAKLCEKADIQDSDPQIEVEYKKAIEEYKFNEALNVVWIQIKLADKHINENEPWKIEDREKLSDVLQKAVDTIRLVGSELLPFMPETAEKIISQFSGDIKFSASLFPRI